MKTLMLVLMLVVAFTLAGAGLVAASSSLDPLRDGLDDSLMLRKPTTKGGGL